MTNDKKQKLSKKVEELKHKKKYLWSQDSIDPEYVLREVDTLYDELLEILDIILEEEDNVRR